MGSKERVKQLEVAVAEQRDHFQATIAELKKRLTMSVFALQIKTKRLSVNAKVELNNAATRKVANQ